jgi:predicted transcriptional regulator
MRHSAADCGLAPMMLRRHFSRRWGVTPHAYRHRFSQLAGYDTTAGAGSRRYRFLIIPNECGLYPVGHHEAASAVTG